MSLAQMRIAVGDAEIALDKANKILHMQPNNETALMISGAA